MTSIRFQNSADVRETAKKTIGTWEQEQTDRLVVCCCLGRHFYVIAPSLSLLPLPIVTTRTMLISTATRSLLRSNAAILRQNVRLMSSVASSEKETGAAVGLSTTAKRKIHSDPPQMKSAPPLQYASQPTYFPEDVAEEKEEATSTSGLVDRFKITAEVTVSKIFPAGFG